MKTIVLACLLGLLAASLAEDTAQTEQVDDGAELDREVREVTEVLENVDTATYVKILNRQKRHLRDLLCGQCHMKTAVVQPPCHKLKWVSYQKDSKCGWWKRRHSCKKTRHHFEMRRYCCDRGRLFTIFGVFHVCINKHLPGFCGGFFVNGPKYSACKLGSKRFCSPRYRRDGDYCYKK